MIHDRLRMPMESTNFLGLWIDSRSGFVFHLSVIFTCICYMNDFNKDVMYMDY
jgi:hypothetical protein